ncbi:EthD family reductase [Sphingobium sp.]|uniref:EthD family reductase n=1 Tax=Sphingobium sp. TaxID=1912891 RepID=UPI0028BD790B|nr:EthD family reductase [Sphingobium sp.]
MKSIVLMRARGDGLPPDLSRLLAERPWAGKASRIVVHCGMAAPAETGGPAVPPIYDAVAEIWSDAPIGLEADGLLIGLASLDIRMSREVVGKAGDGPAPVGVTSGLSQLSFIRAKPGMLRSEVERHWDEHIPLACEVHVGMNRYVQDRLSAGEGDAEPWFGMAHLHFPDEAALRDGLFRTPEDVAVISADVAEFVDDYATMLAIEHVVKGK